METRNDIRPFLPQHPGTILREELKERGIKQKVFAEMIGMRPSHLNALLHGARNISPLVATRIENALQIPARVWLNLQSNYDLDMLRTAELVEGYTPSAHPTYALADSVPKDQWEAAFRAGQKDAARRVSEALNMSKAQIDQIIFGI